MSGLYFKLLFPETFMSNPERNNGRIAQFIAVLEKNLNGQSICSGTADQVDRNSTGTVIGFVELEETDEDNGVFPGNRKLGMFRYSKTKSVILRPGL